MVTEQTLNNIKQTCLLYNIENYSINSDYSVDVDGNVNLSSRNLTVMPLRFHKVMGHFTINNNLLTTLSGGPLAVGGNFNCYYNKLINFAGGPKWVGGDFYAYRNLLTSLKGSPDEVVGNYYVSANNLTNLSGSTLKIGGDFSFDDTLVSTFSRDDDIEFGGDFLLNETLYDNLNYRKLPIEIINNRQYMKLILKYQRYFQIWNEDLTFNVENFNDLIAEIEEGLR